MNALEQIRRLWDHAAWADATLLGGLAALPDPPATAIREYGHIIGAEEVWLARLQARAPALAVWPDLSVSELARLARATRTAYAEFIALVDGDLSRSVSYTNTAGRSFQTPVGDILLHVTLHGHYHRGKVNLMLRHAGAPPVPVDFIGFVRGVPAASEGSASVLRADPSVRRP